MRRLPRFIASASNIYRRPAASRVMHFSDFSNPKILSIDSIVKLAVEGQAMLFARELERFLDIDDKKIQAKSLFAIFTKLWSASSNYNLPDSYEYNQELVDLMKKKNLFEEFIAFCKTNNATRPLLFHSMDSRLRGRDLDIILQTPLKRLAMVEYDGQTALDYALNLDNPEVALAYAYKFVNYVDDLDVVLRCKEMAKARLFELVNFNLEKEALMDIGRSSCDQEILPYDLQVELGRRNMPLDKILSRLEKTLRIKDRFGKVPTVFFPYYDSEWSKKPLRAMRNFGMEIAELYDGEVPFIDCISKDALQKLDKIIFEKVKNSNGVVIVGNTANIDSALYSDDAKIPNFFDPNNRRNFVELLTINHALRLDKPIWGICGGMQLIAVAAMNAKLIDVKDQYLKNNHLDKIRVVKDSFLKRKSSYNSEGEETDSEVMDSYSAHYQAIEEAYLAKDARVVAYFEGDPKIVKAIEGDGIILTQMHLESMLHTRSARNALGNFAAACVEDLRRELEQAYTPAPEIKVAMAEKVVKILHKFPCLSAV